MQVRATIRYTVEQMVRTLHENSSNKGKDWDTNIRTFEDFIFEKEACLMVCVYIKAGKTQRQREKDEIKYRS